MTLNKLIGIILLIGIVAVVVMTTDVRRAITGGGEKKDSKVSLHTPQTVCVTRGGSYYHRLDCPELEGKHKVIRPLASAKELYQPCPVCKPPR